MAQSCAAGLDAAGGDTFTRTSGLYYILEEFCTFNRIESMAQPLTRRWDSSEGTSWRIFAAVALLSSNRHHTRPSIGPAFTEALSVTGISGCTALRRATESRVSSVSRNSVGESSLACSSEKVWWRRFMNPFVEWSTGCI